jgi:hypothetical protein
VNQIRLKGCKPNFAINLGGKLDFSHLGFILLDCSANLGSYLGLIEVLFRELKPK